MRREGPESALAIPGHQILVLTQRFLLSLGRKYECLYCPIDFLLML